MTPLDDLAAPVPRAPFVSPRRAAPVPEAQWHWFHRARCRAFAVTVASDVRHAHRLDHVMDVGRDPWALASDGNQSMEAM